MSKPLLPFIRYTMPAHTPAEVLVENAGKLGSSLRAISRIPGIFGVDMCRTIDDLTSVILYSELFRAQSPKHAPEIFDEELEEYFNNEVLYTEYCLLNDRWTPDGSSLRGDDTLEGAVRLACLLFHNTTLWPFYPAIAPLFPIPIFTLQSALRNGIAAGYYETMPEPLIWISFIGACAAKYMPPIRAFFIDELAAAIHRHYSSSFTSPPSLWWSSSSPSSSPSLSSSPSSPSSTPLRIHSFDDFHNLLQGYLYVDRCYLAESKDIYSTIFAAAS